jgi:hypothetical protein
LNIPATRPPIEHSRSTSEHMTPSSYLLEVPNC